MSDPDRARLTIKLLLVDDMPLVHSYLRKIMDLPPPIDVELGAALTLDEGLALARNKPFHCILLDLHYAQAASSDFDIERAIDLIPTFNEFAPVVVVTGYNTDSLWSRCIDQGAYDFLAKDAYIGTTEHHIGSDFTEKVKVSRSYFLHAITNAIFRWDAERKHRAAAA